MNSFVQTALISSLLACGLLSGCRSLDQAALKNRSLEWDADNFDAAVATRSEEIIGVRSPIEAVRLLRRGVRGGSSWTNQIFKVPSVASEDILPIAQKLEILIVRDESSGAKMPKLQRHSRSEQYALQPATDSSSKSK